MSDDLKWRNRHAVLLREPVWKGIATRENYKIRADLRPLFEAHPDSLGVLDALAAEGLYREGCEFIARMTHRRAAVWWGYRCMLSLMEERAAVESGAVRREPDELELLVREAAAKAGVKLPEGMMSPPKDEDFDNFCKMPEFDIDKMLASPKPPPQDDTAIKAASEAVKGKADALRALVPPELSTVYGASYAKVDGAYAKAAGQSLSSAFDRAVALAGESPLTYEVRRADSPELKKIIGIADVLETRRKGIIAEIKAAFPEKYPVTPQAAMLLKADRKRLQDDAVQAVWRWIVSPDERNTTLAMAAGNAAAGTPEGLLAFVAAWSFGDLAPEGAQTVPVPPELPGTGLNAVLLEMALDKGGTRKMGERYELYFRAGMDVIFARDLWPDAVAEKDAPHVKIGNANPA